MERQRVAWVDYAKGFCIVMVVMMHSTLGVENAAGQVGWMHHVVEFAKPFRMPDFFMIAGLFLARTIDRDWRTYIDRKVVHFAYFYLLWLTIQFVFKAPGIVAAEGTGGLAREYAMALIEPFGTMWFIYVLPIFFVIAKMTRRLPWWAVWLPAAALEILPVHTGWTVIDETAARFVYFYSGYVFAPHIFRFVDWVLDNARTAALALVAWAVFEAVVVAAGISEMPVVGLGLGFIGAMAVATFAGLLSKSDLMAPLRFCGQHSIVIYLAFFLPMAISRTVLLKTGIIPDIGTVSLLVTAAGVIAPALFYLVVRNTPVRFVFERPAWARLGPARRPAMVAAE